jgi:protein-tyrosine phosphatase
VRRDTLQLTERAIAVMRRRRSVKAVETLEQVQFLAEYVDYLREGVGREGRS